MNIYFSFTPDFKYTQDPKGIQQQQCDNILDINIQLENKQKHGLFACEQNVSYV